MLIDRYLPKFDVTQVVEVEVEAPPEQTYAAIRDTDLRDPIIAALFAVREAPQRLARRWRGDAPPAPPGPVTLGSITTGGPGWTLLAEDPGREFVVGSIGRFWEKDYGGRAFSSEEFVPFREPGFAKLAISFEVRRGPGGGSLLRYEARTGTTDAAARRTFGRYWRVIHLGVAVVMRRALKRIRKEAERRTDGRVSASRGGFS